MDEFQCKRLRASLNRGKAIPQSASLAVLAHCNRWKKFLLLPCRFYCVYLKTDPLEQRQEKSVLGLLSISHGT